MIKIMENNSETTVFNKIWALGLNAWLPVFAFSIPFLISGSQLITGSIVNTLLFIAATQQINRKSLYFIALLPSLGAISNGILFGKFTPFLLYFVPSIWIANMVLILSFTKFRKTFSFPLNIFFSTILKTTILYLTAVIFVNIQVVPKIFLTSMGLLQLITALIGGVVTNILFKISKHVV